MSDDAASDETAPPERNVEAVTQFLRAYDEHRVVDQTTWYRKTATEYERSSRQIAWVSEVAILGASICGILTMVWPDSAAWLGITAAALAALSAAVMSWADVVGFTTNADLYRDAYNALGRLRPNRPSRGATKEQVAEYVDAAEDVMRNEVKSWTAEWRMVDEDADEDTDAAVDDVSPEDAERADSDE
jgi:hypothetical protein